MLAFGYEPGGLGNNGVALIDQSGGLVLVATSTVDSVDEAVGWLQAQVGARRLDAAGIDTYLSWATVNSGWRPMDVILRQTYPQVQHSVFSSNSAAGSMAIQGMAMAMRLRALWPEVRLNETHPKILYFALTSLPYVFGQGMITWLGGHVNAATGVAITNDHEWDALISAWATVQGMTGGFSRDRLTGVPDLLFPVGQVNYFWPQVFPAHLLRLPIGLCGPGSR